MNSKSSNPNKATVIKASYDLQKKVGKGPIEDAVIKKSQTLIERNEVDFVPVARDILDRLKQAIEETRNPHHSFEEIKQLFTQPVMELKANAAIFHYSLVGSLSNVMLGFLENIRVIDKDAVEIVRAQHESLEAIITRKLSGDGGATGQALVKELQGACDRYYNKKFGK